MVGFGHLASMLTFSFKKFTFAERCHEICMSSRQEDANVGFCRGQKYNVEGRGQKYNVEGRGQKYNVEGRE